MELHILIDRLIQPHERDINSRNCETINKIPKDKAAGYDGVDINLIKLLIEGEDCPLIEILLILNNAQRAFIKDGCVQLHQLP